MNEGNDDRSDVNEPEALRATAPAIASPDGGLVPGAAVGSFVVERELGRGTTALVVAAYDPALDRRVAIKLLHPAPSGISAERRARFLREARALAKLRHPNVITVYQAGTVADQVFIAMEIVEGETLGAWLERTQPKAPEILEAFVLAGRGLAAAHRAGLVHRDFKPENVLRDKDGRVLVTDFGLVAAPSGASPEGAPGPAGSDALTQTGEVLGTPRYMSPEQHTGQPTDARTDQFSFAVALHEALHRRLPFAGSDWQELRENVLAGRPQAAPRLVGVPRRAAAALRRALAVDPADRFPSMDAMVARLERRPAITVGRAALLAGLVAAGLAALAVVRDRSRTCSGAGAQIAGVWDEGRKDAVRAAFLATGRPHAAATFAQTASILDGYARSWAAMKTDACEATAVRHEQSEAVRSLRMACLDQRLGAFSALTRLFAEQASPELVDGAIRAAQGLEGLAGCADTAALAAGVPLPPRELAGRVAELRASLDRARALLAAGRGKEARELLERLAVDARAAGYKPLLAQVLVKLGEVQADTRDGNTTRATIEEAMAVAADVKDDASVARALGLLMQVLTTKEAKPAEALALRPAMEAAVRRAGNDDLLRALLHERVGAALSAQGTFGDAVKELEHALALREAARDRNDVEVVRTLSALARILVRDGKYDEAHARLLAALELSEKVLGPDHPDVGNVYTELGTAAFEADRMDDALSFYERALAILRKALGEDAELTGAALHNVAMILDEQRRFDEALALYRRALEIREKALGPDHPGVASTLMNLGITLINKGDLRAARPYLERVVAIREKNLGPEHPDLATALVNLGNLVADLGELDAAVPYLERAVAIRRKALRPGHPSIARALTELGGLATSRGRANQAIPLLQEASAILGDDPQNAPQAAKTRFRLAQAQWAAGDRKLARRLAADARAVFVARKMDGWTATLDEWTKSRRTSRP